MKVGRRLAIKLLNASKFVLSMAAGGGAVTEPLDRPCSPDSGEVVARVRPTAFERLPVPPGPRAGRDVLLVVLRRLPRAGQVPRLRIVGRRRVAGPTASARAALALALSVQLRLLRAVPPVRHRGGVELVAGGLHPPRPLARGGRAGRAEGGDPAVLEVVAEVLGGDPADEDRGQALAADPGRAGWRSSTPGPRLAAVRAAEHDLRRGWQRRASSSLREGAGAQIIVELADEDGSDRA